MGHQFFEFKVELNHDESDIECLAKWKEITSKTEVSKHKKGIGQTFGALAIEVLTEIRGNG